MKVSYAIKALTAFRSGRIGDAAAYKALLIDVRPRADMKAALARLNSPLPRIDLAPLRALPTGSFGRTYADHMDACGLKPLEFSEDCRTDLADKTLLAPRYTLFHDAFHVLLDRDTTLAGECAVWAFVSGQRYARAFDRAGLVSVISYSLIKPWKCGAFLKAYRDGFELGRRAAKVLAAPLETLWATPIAEVRRKLGIEPA